MIKPLKAFQRKPYPWTKAEDYRVRPTIKFMPPLAAFNIPPKGMPQWAPQQQGLWDRMDTIEGSREVRRLMGKGAGNGAL